MPNIYYGFDELRKAAKNLKAFLLHPHKFEGHHDDWDDFLIHLDASWDKIEAGFKDISNKFSPFQAEYRKLRKEDELLKYLFQSRNVITHNTEIPFTRRILSKSPLYYWKYEFLDEQNKILQTEFVPVYKIQLILQDITSRGVKYFPPKTHLGERLIDGKEPLEVGIKAIVFYFKYIETLDAKFTDNCLKDQFARFWIDFNIAEINRNIIKTSHGTDDVKIYPGAKHIRTDNKIYIRQNVHK